MEVGREKPLRRIFKILQSAKDARYTEQISPLQAMGSCPIASWHSIFQVDAERVILESGISF
jgi:hypothetical protein